MGELESQREYLDRLVYRTLRPAVACAIIFFLAKICFVALTAPFAWRTPLLVQKCAFAVILGLIYRRCTPKGFPHRWANLISSLVLGLFVASVSFTVIAGNESQLCTDLGILFLAAALINQDPRWALVHWLSFWLAWLGLSTKPSLQATGNQLVILAGFQLAAVATLFIRRASSLEQYQLLRQAELQGQQLSQALVESEQSRATLDQRVEERTKQLLLAYNELQSSLKDRQSLQEQLLQSQKMESLGRLAGGVAHDFNNLLTVVIGNLELAREEKPGQSDWTELLQDAETAAKRAAEVTSQLLAFSRKQVMKAEPLEWSDLIKDSLKLVQRLLGEHITLNIDVDVPGTTVLADKTQLRQVLMNLVINASDVMPSGGRLDIILRSNPDTVTLSISDTGPGVDPTLGDRIFEPFFTTKRVGEGTGLGLSTVLGIVSQHGGTVTVNYNDAPRGATFVVTLPRVKTASRRGASGSDVRPLPSGKVGSILLVEDDEQVRKFAAQVLRCSGYQVCTAENGERALQSPPQHLDLLVTDVVMPGLDGARLATLLRERQPGLPVLFISGYTDDKLSHFGIEAELCNFLGKPFTPVQLASAVSEALGAPSA